MPNQAEEETSTERRHMTRQEYDLISYLAAQTQYQRVADVEADQESFSSYLAEVGANERRG